jgi:hypothetical protein
MMPSRSIWTRLSLKLGRLIRGPFTPSGKDFVCLLCGRAQAHGPEQWIADENLHDPASDLFCCGPNDCKPLKRGDVSETMGGWLVKEQGDPVAEFIPYSRGIPKSPDGRYHRCINVASIQGYGYKRVTRCFIVPPPGV